MPKTLQEVDQLLKDFVQNNEHGEKVAELSKKVSHYLSLFPFSANDIVYADDGYDPELGSSWNDLMTEDKDGNSSIIASLDQYGSIFANSGEDPEFKTEWNELVLEVSLDNGKNEEIIVLDLI